MISEFTIGCFVGSLFGTAFTIWLKNKEIKLIRKNCDEAKDVFVNDGVKKK